MVKQFPSLPKIEKTKLHSIPLKNPKEKVDLYDSNLQHVMKTN